MLKISEAAKILGISKDTLRRWEKSGKLVSHRSPSGYRYYNPEDLQALIKPEDHSLDLVRSLNLGLSRFEHDEEAKRLAGQVHTVVPGDQEIERLSAETTSNEPEKKLRSGSVTRASRVFLVLIVFLLLLSSLTSYRVYSQRQSKPNKSDQKATSLASQNQLGSVLAASTSPDTFLEINTNTNLNGALNVNGDSAVSGSQQVTGNVSIGGTTTLSALTTGVVHATNGLLGIAGINLGTEVANILGVANGGTGVATVPSNGQILIGSDQTYKAANLTAGSGITITNGAGAITITNSNPAVSGVTSITGTGNQIIASGSTGDVTLTLPQSIGTTSTPTFGGLTLSAPLTVASGGTGAATFTTNGILYGNGTGVIQVTAAGTSGQVLTPNGSGVPVWASVTGSGSGFCTDCVLSDPSTSQTITPTGDHTGLTVVQTATASPTAYVFDVTNNAGSTKYLSVNSSGNVGIGVSSANNTFQVANLINFDNGNLNNYVGYLAGTGETTGLQNTGVGYEALISNADGNANTAFGYEPLFSTTSGYGNTAVGLSALYSNNTGFFNTAVGWEAGFAGTAITTGSSDTFLGYSAAASSATLTNATAIGANSSVGCSNCLILGSVNGVNGATSNVSVGIGTTNPSSLFSVGSTSQFQVNSSGAIAAATGITSSGNISFTGLTSAAGSGLCLNGSNQVSTCSTGSSAGTLQSDYNNSTGGATPEIVLDTTRNALTIANTTADAITGNLLEVVNNANNTTYFGVTKTASYFGGNVGIGTTSPTNILSLAGNSAQTFWMERETTGNTAGNNLTIQSGGATSGATDKNGGDLYLVSGTSTGAGSSNINFQVSNTGSSGTVDNTPTTLMTISGSGNNNHGQVNINGQAYANSEFNVIGNGAAAAAFKSGDVYLDGNHKLMFSNAAFNGFYSAIGWDTTSAYLQLYPGGTGQIQFFNTGNYINSNGSLFLGQSGVAGGQTALSITPGSHSGVTAEVNDLNIGAHTDTITGAIATQRFDLFGQPTLTASTAETVTNASTVAIVGAPIGAGVGPASITTSAALRISAGSSLSTAVSNAYGLYVDAPTGANNNYAATFASGNVGIGTTSPTALLSVGSTSQFQVNSSGAIAAATGITSSGTIKFSGLSASSAVYTDGSSNLTSTAPTSGALGYWSRSGTTLSPTTANDIVSVSTNAATGTPLALTSSAITTTGSAGMTNTVTVSGSSSSETYYGSKLALTNNQTASADTLYGDYISFTDAGSVANTVTGLYVDATTANTADTTYAAVFQGGNVGIGTASPAANLDISSSTTTGTALKVTDNSLTTGSLLSLNSSSITGSAGSGINSTLTTNPSANSTSQYGSYLNLTANDTGSFTGNSVYGSYTTITNNTNTANTIYGNYINISDAVNGPTNNDYGLYIQSSTTTVINDTGIKLSGIRRTGIDISASGSGSNDEYGIKLVANANGSGTTYGISSTVSNSGGGAAYAGIFSGGNVGIGTTTPGVTLDVAGAIRTNNNLYVDGGTSNLTSINDIVNVNKTLSTNATDSWSSGTAGGTGRYGQTSVLYNGKIYSWGGSNAGGYLNTMDIYDIASDTWSTGATGGTARRNPTSTLYNGKIYFWGGINGSGYLNTVDIYDIAGNSWTTGTAGGTARQAPSATLYNGKIYFWAGRNAGFLNTVDIYDIAGNSWTTGTAGGTARYGHSSVLYNGKIYSWGGYNGSSNLNTVDIYDIVAASWSTGTAGGTTRQFPTSVLYNGKIYSWGGTNGAAINTVDIYDIAAASWSTGTAGGTARGMQSSVFYNGKVYSWGGTTDGGFASFLNTLDIYDIGFKQTILALQENGQDTLSFQTGSQLFLSSGRLGIMGGNVGIGTTSPGGLLDVSKSISATPSLTGQYLSFSASTFTDNNTAGSGVATNMAFNSIAAPTLAASNTSVTTTNAYTLYIAGGPSAGTNETITNSYALGVNGNTSIVGSASATVGSLKVANSNASAVGMALMLSNLSANNTANAVELGFSMNNNTPVEKQFGGIRVTSTAVTGTSEVGTMVFRTLNLGTMAQRFQLTPTQGVDAAFVGSTTATGGGAFGVRIVNTNIAAANNDVLYGLQIAPTLTPGTFTGLSYYGLHVAADSTSFTATSGNKIGAFIDTMSGTNVANYGAYIAGASGATNNYGLYINAVASASTNYGIYDNAAAQNYFAGNVGIGITNPSNSLDVQNSGSVGLFRLGTTTNNNILTVNNTGRLTYGSTSTYIGGSVINFGNNAAAADTDFFLIDPSSSNTGNLFNVQKANTSKFLVDTNGNVGIGTTSPGVTLDVVGAVRTNNNLYVDGGTSNLTSLNDVVNVNKSLGANATDSWSTGTAGGTARVGHTSVLYNGKIYSWGGINSGSTLINTVDIYDIASNSWSTGAAGGTARENHTSVLYNGKIYSWGGYNGSAINTVDIYNIASNSWSTGAAGGTARQNQTSVLYNGKIYSWGGLDSGSTPLNTVDIYDIASNSWSTGAAGGTARYQHTSVLYNGKIYSWGGSAGGSPFNTVDIYDIANNSWTTGTAGGTARKGHSSVLYNGKIYSWGGLDSGLTYLNSVDIYDIVAASWSTGTAGGTARNGHSSVLYNGKIYSWAGFQTGATKINTVDIYDIGYKQNILALQENGQDTLDFQTGSQLFLNSGRLGIMGGNVGIGTTAPGSQLDVLSTVSPDPRGIISDQISTDTGGAQINFRKARGSVGSLTTVASADVLGNLAYRGYDGTSYVLSAAVKAIVNGTVSTGILPTDLQFQTMNSSGTLAEAMRIAGSGNVGIGTTNPTTALNIVSGTQTDGGMAYNFDLWSTTTATAGAAGGSGIRFVANTNGAGTAAGLGGIEGVKENSTAGDDASALLFETRTNSNPIAERMRISSAGNVGIGTTNPGTALDVVGAVRTNNNLYVDGGTSNLTSINDIVNVNKTLSTNATDSWSSGTAGGTARQNHTATLYNGKIYFWGGTDGTATTINTMDIYDIASATWSTGAAGGTARQKHTGTLYNGKIYFWGGGINSMDIYNIAGNSWSTGAAGGVARFNHTGTLYNGKIYFWGGGSTGTALNTMDIYDIAGNSWTTGTAGGTARWAHTSVLYNGKIYSWGGNNNAGTPINTVDIYNIAAGSWSTGTAGGTARYYHSSFLYNGKIYSYAGFGVAELNSVDIYDIVAGSWSTGTAGGTARDSLAAAFYNGKLYTWGGSDISSVRQNAVDIYDVGYKQTILALQENGQDTLDFQTGSQLFLNNGRLGIMGGNVGIGTTAPSNTLQVIGSICAKSTNAACAGNVAGDLYATVTTVQGADMAENYVSSQGLEPGDLVTPANDGNNMAVTKTTSTYQTPVIGVVSTAPGVVLNSDAVVDPTHPNLYPIALNGRVPIKVSTENGSIAVGDLLTPSSVPGVAMKATRPGPIVAKALDNYSNADPTAVGKILGFMDISFGDPNNVLANLTVDNTGNLITPVKTDALQLGGVDKVRLTALEASLDPATLSEVGDAANSGIDSTHVDLATTINTIMAAQNDVQNKVTNLQSNVDTLASNEASNSAQIAGISTEVASSSAQLASHSDLLSQISQKLDSLVASSSANLNLTPPDALLATGSATLADLKVTNSTSTLKLDTIDATVSGTLKSLGDSYLGNTTIAGDLAVNGTFSVSSTGDGNVINSLPTLYLQNSPLASLVDFFNGLVTIDKQGAVTLQKLTIPDVRAAGLSNDPTIGSATIAASQTQVQIINNQITQTAKVFITPRGQTGGQSLVVDSVNPGYSFRVSLDHAINKGITFDWLIVETK